MLIKKYQKVLENIKKYQKVLENTEDNQHSINNQILLIKINL